MAGNRPTELSVACTTPPPSTSKSSWDEPIWESPIDPARQIFCNRTLNMKSIKSVGFDMDYTLAQYKEDTFEALAYRETVKKLVEQYNYPECLHDFEFDTTYMVRGLVIDKELGNVLKMDRHKYVKLALHGFRQLSSEQRKHTYGNASQRQSFDGRRFSNIDTLFALAEAYLFCQLVDLKDDQSGNHLADKTYYDLYTETRQAVDLCHRDGSLKVAVANDPARFIHKDPSLLPMLKNLRMSGRQTFIVTNSLWDFTNVVMNFLLEGKTGKDMDHSWLQYFDVVIVGSKKPQFFAEHGNILFEVDLPTGLLHNTDNGSPLVPVDVAVAQDANLSEEYRAKAVMSDGTPRARVFQNGSFTDLHAMLGVDSGSQVLYAGDHIYGDILRSKKTIGWRTLLIVPELESELRTLMLGNTNEMMAQFHKLRDQRDTLDDQLQRLEWNLQHSEQMSPESRQEIQDMIVDLREERDHYKHRHETGMREYHQRFHPVWGSLMHTGYQNSRFANQIMRFACLYTSHVGNMRAYSPEKRYQCREDSMPHVQPVQTSSAFESDVDAHC